MRVARLLVLLGALVATGALYLKHLAVDAGGFTSLTGAGVPTIWQELGSGARLGATLVAAALVGLCFRPHRGRWDRWGALAALAAGAAGLAGAVLARQAAAADAGVVAAALQTVPGGAAAGAAPGPGYWVLFAGGAVILGGLIWDLGAAWWGWGEAGVGVRTGDEPDAGGPGAGESAAATNRAVPGGRRPAAEPASFEDDATPLE